MPQSKGQLRLSFGACIVLAFTQEQPMIADQTICRGKFPMNRGDELE